MSIPLTGEKLSDIILFMLILLGQLLGFFAVGLSLAIYQTDKRNKMLLLAMFAAALYTVHFTLIGALTAAVLNALSVARCFVFYEVKPSRKNRWIVYCFLVLNVIAGILFWQGWISLFAIAGSMFGIIAGWQRKPKTIRRYALLPPPLWFVYDFASGSYAGMTIEVIRFCSNLVGQYRFDIRHRRHLQHKLAHPA